MRAFAGRRVLVVGDLIADQFVSGEISRVSREAPVMILRHERTETVPGGAANCALNLATLGARASVVGAVGEDASGRELLGRLEGSGVDCRGVVVAPELKTTTKVRILAGHAHSERIQHSAQLQGRRQHRRDFCVERGIANGRRRRQSGVQNELGALRRTRGLCK